MWDVRKMIRGLVSLLCALLLAHGISVQAAGLPPVFTSPAEVVVAEGSTSSIDITTSDPEGDTVTVAAVSLWPWMSFDGSTLTLSPGYNDARDYNMRFTATDGKSTTVSSLLVSVTDTNRAPRLLSVQDTNIVEGTTTTIAINARDPDGDTVTVTPQGLQSWMSFDGTIFTATPGFADSGTYAVNFEASDGALTASTALTLTVINRNQLPGLDTLSLPDVPEGESQSILISASDPDGDAVTITAPRLQPWMSFDGVNLVVSPDFGDEGSYDISFVTDDGLNRNIETLNLTVTNNNRVPAFADLATNWTIGIGTVLSLPIYTTDPDGDAVTVQALGLERWMSFDGTRLQARPKDGSQIGNYTITLEATDGTVTTQKDLSISVDEASPGHPAAWNAHFGSIDQAATWSTWQRSSLGGYTGLSLVNNPGLVDELVNIVASHPPGDEFMLGIRGFIAGSEGDESLGDFLNLIEDGGLPDWQIAVNTQVAALAPLDLEGTRIIYQLGNEITSEAHSSALRDWAAIEGITLPGEVQPNDLELVPYYVEYYFAPTVEALKQSSQEFYGDPDRLRLVLGSIANGGTPNAKLWLDTVLGYTIEGTFAPSLTGMQVNELVEMITAHYVGTSANMDSVWDTWNGVGGVKALWITEEIGGRAAEEGKGSGGAAWILSNQLEWYYRRGFTAEQARVCYWGWKIEGAQPLTNADESMMVYHDFMGDSPVEVLTSGFTQQMSVGEADTFYHFSINDEDRRTIVVTSTQVTGGTLDSLEFDKKRWSGDVAVTLHHFSPAGHTTETLSVTEGKNTYTINFTQPVVFLADRESLMITLQHL